MDKEEAQALDSKTVRARVKEIEKIAERDNEVAHVAEDVLMRDVLLAISSCRSLARAKALAEAALLAQKIDYARWYA
jgi:hypothetical protein